LSCNKKKSISILMYYQIFHINFFFKCQLYNCFKFVGFVELYPSAEGVRNHWRKNSYFFVLLYKANNFRTKLVFYHLLCIISWSITCWTFKQNHLQISYSILRNSRIRTWNNRREQTCWGGNLTLKHENKLENNEKWKAQKKFFRQQQKIW
jgi:hypothetical protein